MKKSLQKFAILTVISEFIISVIMWRNKFWM